MNDTDPRNPPPTVPHTPLEYASTDELIRELAGRSPYCCIVVVRDLKSTLLKVHVEGTTGEVSMGIHRAAQKFNTLMAAAPILGPVDLREK